jgi:hypothetical protein
MANTSTRAAQALLVRHFARLAVAVTVVSVTVGCSMPVASSSNQPREFVGSAFGEAGSRAGVKRRTVRLDGRRNELSVEVPIDWTVGSPRLLDQIDDVNRNRAEHFLLAEIVVMDPRDKGESSLVVSVRRPPTFSAESIASTSAEDVGEANAQLLKDAGLGPLASSDVGPINVAQWALRQIEVNGQSIRCVEATIFSRIGGDHADADLSINRTLYIPRPLSEIRVQMTYLARDEQLLLPVLETALASLRY